MVSNSLEEQENTTGLLEKSGDKEIGRVEISSSSVLTHDFSVPCLKGILSRHPTLSLPLEQHDQEIIIIPYQCHIPEDRQMEIRNTCENWLLNNEIVSKDFIQLARRIKMTSNGWEMIKNDNPHDYHPLVFSYLLADKVFYEKLGNFLKFHEPGRFARYHEAQEEWFSVDALMHKEKTGKWPSIEDKCENFMNGLNMVYRPYFILKEDALGEKVHYPYAKELIRRVNHEMHIE